MRHDFQRSAGHAGELVNAGQVQFDVVVSQQTVIHSKLFNLFPCQHDTAAMKDRGHGPGVDWLHR